MAAILNAANFQKITEKEETLVKYFGLKKEPITFTNYERVAIYIKFKEEEFKEAILAYYFLLAEDRDLTITELDETVERWFENNHNCRINFEIEDGMDLIDNNQIWYLYLVRTWHTVAICTFNFICYKKCELFLRNYYYSFRGPPSETLTPWYLSKIYQSYSYVWETFK